MCAGRHAVNRVSAWTRTALYTHHVVALQFDSMQCPPVKGYEHLVVVICLFCRWLWLIPTMDRAAVSVAEVLLTKVFGPWNI